MEEKPLYAGVIVYREMGACLRRLEQLDKAKIAYDEAYKLNPNDISSVLSTVGSKTPCPTSLKADTQRPYVVLDGMLIGRSQVYSDALEPQEAFAAAELALKLEPQNLTAKNTQACAVYTMSEFEQSYVMNSQGARVRKQPAYFTEGIIQCKQTIEDCVGHRAGNVMLDFLPIIKKMHPSYAGDLEPVEKLHVSRIPKPDVKVSQTHIEAKKHETLARVLAMKYLGAMADDKFYIQDLMKDPRLPSANTSGTKKLKTIIEKEYEKLCKRQEMLRTQLPYYSIKKAEKSRSEYLSKYKKDTLNEEIRTGAEYAERVLKDIKKCFEDRRFMELIKKSQRFQTYLDNKTLRNLPNMNQYTNMLYKYVGLGCLSQYRISYKLSDKSNSRRVYFLLGITKGRARSYDSVIYNHFRNPSDLATEIEKKLQILESRQNPYHRCWLYYELARLANSMKNNSLSKFYALKCDRQAVEVESIPWRLIACFSSMSIDLQEENEHEFKIRIAEATDLNKELLPLDLQSDITGFLRVCSSLISNMGHYADESHANMKRQKDILNVLDPENKVEATVLFKKISTVPHGRQFSVLPKLQEPLNMTAERRKRIQPGLTVVPGKDKTLWFPPKSKVAGHQYFDV